MKNVPCPSCHCSKYCLEEKDFINCLNCGKFKKSDLKKLVLFKSKKDKQK
jgi:hypothetical protein